VAETTRIISKEERGRSYEPSFTIISRIRSPVEQMLALLPPRPSWTPNFLARRTEAIPIRKEESPPSSRTSSSSFNGQSAWPPHNASNLVMIGEAEPVVDGDQQRHVESARKYGGLFTVEKGMVRYRSSQQSEEEMEGNLSGNGHYSRPESPVTFGLWEMMKTRRPQKWDALNKLLPSRSTTELVATTQPTTTTSTAPLSWNVHDSGNHSESFHRLENDDSVLVTDISSSRTEEEKGSSTILPTSSSQQSQLPDATEATNRDGFVQSEDDSIRTTPQPTALPHRFNNSWLLVVRVDDSTCYAATDSFANNGTIVFKRFQSAGLNQSGWTDLSGIENYFPGFGRIAETKPDRLIVRTTIVIADEDEQPLSEQQYSTTPQSINTDTTIEFQTVSFVPSNSSLLTEEIITIHNDSTDAVPHHLESLNFVFRKVDDDKPVVNSVEPIVDAADLNSAVAVHVSNVTAMPTSSTEEQMTPPLLKTLENLLLTHLLPPITSSSSATSSSLPSNSTFTSPSPTSSSTTSSYQFTSAAPLTSTSTTSSTTTTTSTESYFPWVLHHSEPVQSINDWSIVSSQLIEPAPMSSTYSTPSPSTTVLPEKVIQSPAHYDPAINKATLSSHTLIIPSRNPSLVQQQLTPSYPPRKSSPDSSTDKFPSASSIQMFTLKPEVEAPKIVTSKPAPKKNTGLASLILAHTSALMSGNNSPFFNDAQRRSSASNNSSSQSDVRQTKKNILPEPLPVTATVHVIVASPYPDSLEHEEELNRRRSLDSPVRTNNQNAIRTGNSSWAFPSFSQLIESPGLLLTSRNSSSLIRAVNASPISSFNGNTNDDLPPSLPRK
jgi:hypothetical protein